ncbi:VanZ family protein [Nonomuraea longicatena]|uniref:VanZ family protein n=1 Tax=Nonomuraea longicatena TaxID=83682 RepID=UPI0031DAD2DB
MQILPMVGGLTVLAYLAVFLLVRRRRARPPWPRIAAEFLLTGSLVAFVYITQIMQFGNGMGDLLNLAPLRAFSIAAEYGLANTEGLTQLALNVLITFPIGLLLPVVFPSRFGGVLRVFLAGLALTVATELVQLATGRNADLDDVIANAAGAALGAAVTVLVRAVARSAPAPGRWRTASAAFVAVAVVAPFATVTAIDGGNRLGVVYYGHLRPSAVKVPDTIPAHGSSARLYRAAPAQTQEAVVASLRRRLAVKGDCEQEAGAWICADGGRVRFIVHPYATWDAAFGADDTNPGAAPSEAAGRQAAPGHLSAFGLDPATLAYAGVDDRYRDGNLHLDYVSKEQGGAAFLWGKVSLVLGEKGKLLGIRDERIPVRAVETVETVSPREAVDIAQDIGVDAVAGTLAVRTITAAHYFDEDSGYLVPVWRIEGTLTRDSGGASDWETDVDART